MAFPAAARVAQARGAPDGAAELTEFAPRLTPAGSAARDERRLALASYLELAGTSTARVGSSRTWSRPDRRVTFGPGPCSSSRGWSTAGRARPQPVPWRARPSPPQPTRCFGRGARRCWPASPGPSTSPARPRRRGRRSRRSNARARAGDPPSPSATLSGPICSRDTGSTRRAQRAFELERSAPPAAVDDRVAYKLASGCGTRTTTTARAVTWSMRTSAAQRRATSRRS